MGQSSRTARAPSNDSKEHSFAENKFGTVVRALWPEKPALNLAQRMGITERGAQYIIDGKRRVTFRAARVVLDQFD